MRIRESVEKYYNELPGYNMTGYTTVGSPIFQRRLTVLSLTKMNIPVVEEFLLNFYNEGLSIDEIKTILGLDQQIIDEAFAGLLQRDYINYLTRRITESGKAYLSNNKVEKLEKINLNIMIDGITGETFKVNENLMTTKIIKNNGIRSLKANIDKPSLQNLDFNGVRRVFNKYKEEDNEYYTGNVLDIIEIEGNTTKYKKIDILVFRNKDNDVRVIAFDGYKRLEKYEEKLLELDRKGINLFKYEFSDYLNSKNVININHIVKEKEAITIDYIDINKTIEKYLNQNKGSIIISIPLISECDITTSFINDLEQKLSKGLNIKIIISGRDYNGEYQKKVYNKLLQLINNYTNLELIQTPVFINKMILDCDKGQGLVSIFEKSDINLNASKLVIAEKIYEIKDSNFYTINKIVNNFFIRDIPNMPNLSIHDKTTLFEKIEFISRLVKDADGYIYSNDDIGWIGGGEIPEIENMLSVPLANSSDKFRTFIDSINKSLVESLSINSKSKGEKTYFWTKFKSNYEKLHHILDKIKTYRNKSNHLKLDENNSKKYFQYLEEDLKGYMPDFLENGYLILQFKILNELELAIKDTINTIK